MRYDHNGRDGLHPEEYFDDDPLDDEDDDLDAMKLKIHTFLGKTILKHIWSKRKGCNGIFIVTSILS